MDDELTPAQLEELGEALDRLREDLTAVATDASGLSDTVVLDQSRMGRVSRMDALQQQQMAAAGQRRARQRLEGVAAALERLRDDDYGWCPACGEAIGYRRLRAVPETVFCVPCLQQRE